METIENNKQQSETVNPQPTINPKIEVVAQGLSFRKAFKETAAERTALRQEELCHIAFDVSLAISMVLAATARIERFKEEIAKLPIDHGFLAKLDMYVHAAGHAHARCNRNQAPPEELRAIYEQAVEFRSKLYSDATNLVRQDKLGESALSEIRNESGFRKVSFDLMALVDIFRDFEPSVASRISTTPEDLDAAELVAGQLLELASRRDDALPSQPALGEDRLRSLSLMVRCYQEARRAIQFVRFHHGDAELIAPSIYTARTRKRDGSQDTSDDDLLIPTPVLPTTGITAAVIPAVTQPTHTQPAALPQVVHPEQPAVPIGALGGNPFA